MSRFGFVGASYQMQSVNADAQMCKNWYVEPNESGEGKSAKILVPTPGLSLFARVPAAVQVRGEFTINGRMFAVIDANLYEILANGTANALGAVQNDGSPCSMTASPFQLLIASSGILYVYQLQSQPTLGWVAGQFVVVAGPPFPNPVTQVEYIDGFFIALVAATEQFFVSNSFDARTWQGVNNKIISTFADNVVSMIADHRELWLLGGKRSEVEYDSGNVFPFDSVPGGFIEQGCGAQFATVQADNSIFWIGSRNDQGAGIAWRAQGYSPVRVSTFAVEFAWASYPTIADARAFSYQDQGHTFWVINFPSGNTTWVYDISTGLWHERGFWDAGAGTFKTALPQNHVFAFGKHLVGDRQSGSIYQMAIPSAAVGGGWNFVTDNNAPIRRVRRSPHVSTEQTWIRYAALQVDFETGLGPQPPLKDGAGNPRPPMATLRVSRDGGHTWSLGRDKGCGQAGKYKRRVIWRRLGRARDMIFEVSVSDPVPFRIVDAYLTATGFQAQERLQKQYSKVA